MILTDIATHLSGTLYGDESLEIETISDIHSAQQGDLTFVLEQKYVPLAQTSSASAFITYKKLDNLSNQIVIKSAKQALSQTILLFQDRILNSYIVRNHLISDHANIAKSATIDKECSIGAYSVISPHVSIGKHCVIGENVIIHPNVTIYDHTIIGNNVVIHAGSVIGSDGFGYHKQANQWLKIPHLGYVKIDDDVEIGANTCIDRGCIGLTHIMQGCKIDNLVHIAHNTIVGEHTAIAAQVGFTGSTSIGEHVMVGGQAGIDTAKIGSYVIITGKAGVTKNIDSHQMVSGFPAWPHKKELKKEAIVRNLIRSDS